MESKLFTPEPKATLEEAVRFWGSTVICCLGFWATVLELATR